MQEGQDKKTYVTIPNKGDIELSYLLDTVDYLRQFSWIYKVWKPTPALIGKSGGSSTQYVGQQFDSKYFDLVEDGWKHDHCEICFTTISNKESYGDTDGYENDNGDWICKECYNLFIIPADIHKTIKSLRNTAK
ncbi:MAG: hypothetical protein ACJ75B_08405 [Flavisolibacter sp.]